MWTTPIWSAGGREQRLLRVFQCIPEASPGTSLCYSIIILHELVLKHSSIAPKYIAIAEVIIFYVVQGVVLLHSYEQVYIRRTYIQTCT